MHIWKKAGLTISVTVFVWLWAAKFIFEGSIVTNELHYDIALVISGTLVFLSEKKAKWHMQRAMASGDEEKIKTYKDAYEKNPILDFEKSSLFFTSILFWAHILWTKGTTQTNLYFLQYFML